MKRFVRVAGLVVSVAALVTPMGAHAGGQVPFSGSDRGGFTLPEDCAGGVRVVISGSGVATHLGRYAYSSVECFDPEAGTFAGSPTLTAANGDTVVGTYSGTVSPTDDPNVVDYQETLIVTGGTGRFAGATGQLVVSGVANLATGEYSQTMSGTLSSPGSA